MNAICEMLALVQCKEVLVVGVVWELEVKDARC